MICSNSKINYYSIRELAPHIAGILLICGGLFHLINMLFLYYGLTAEPSILKYSTYDPDFFDKAAITTESCLGVIEIVLGIGIYRKKKKAMVIAILLVFILLVKCAVFRLLNFSTIIEVLFLFMLIFAFKYHEDDNSRSTRMLKQIVAWVSVILALCFGIFGSYFMRHQYTNINTIVDAVYYTISTYSTVGYGDITPVTDEAKIFTSIMIIIGIGSFMTTLSFVFAPMVENKLKGIFNIMEKITNMKDHVIICGYTKLAKAIISNLNRENVPYIIIDKDSGKVGELEEINANFIIGSPSSKAILNKANIDNARAVMCVFENDAENIITIMAVKDIISAHRRGKDIKVITRIENDYNAEKYNLLGVDKIVSPFALLADSMLEGVV